MPIMLPILLSLVALSSQQQWSPGDYPNPRTTGYQQCKMRSRSNVCDPDEVLSESDRYRLNNELTRLASRTESTGNSFCTKKGMDAVLAITRQDIIILMLNASFSLLFLEVLSYDLTVDHNQSTTTKETIMSRYIEGTQQLANGLRDLWHMDDQCKKSAIFLLSADDRTLYFAPQPNTALKEAEFQAILASKEMQLRTGNFVPALVNIFKEIGKKTDIDPEPTPDANKFAPSIVYYICAVFALLLVV
ncbi:hypothetical protein NECAME_12776 [Necator americanus]|uniref:TPM domain-containing protein n=1 Tax=Necator americanus TaxID=51031 RepID=W2SY86_NECAM|nr:hypothetical protein NECAME_12776 [Necator americanus]ETN74729.1 hypothetical protein NECAME_12776 [Necator americanus]